MSISIQTIISTIVLNSCVYNASGCLCTESDELDALNKSNSCAILTKSSTINARSGNAEPRKYFSNNNNYSINSMGIPNHGYKYYLEYYIKHYNTLTKPFIQSIYPFNTTELANIINHINMQLNDVTKINYLMEINLSCPNVNNTIGSDMLESYFEIIKKYNTLNIPVGIKLPPYYYPHEFDHVSKVVTKYSNVIKYIVCINSIVNGLYVDIFNETTRIKPNDGFGGIGGKACYSVGLANVHQFYKRLYGVVDIVGCGGITSGADVFSYILAGANAVQIGTCLCNEGVSCFERIVNELCDLMKSKGYDSLSEFYGCLKIQ